MMCDATPVAANDNNEFRFYVYAWLYPDGTPFYVGKGQGNRDRADKQNNSIFKRIVAKIRLDGGEPLVVRWQSGLSELDAFDLECAYIKLFGRRNNGTGVLANLTEGGEGSSGRVVSLEERTKTSARHKGKRLSPEHRAILASVVRNPTAETRARMSASQSGRKHSEETRAKMSVNNAMLNPEHRAKVSAALADRTFSDEHRAKLSEYASHRSEDHRSKISAANKMRQPSNGYKGVSFNKSTSKWKVAIRIGDTRPFLGYFANPEDAARAYDVAAVKAWGLGDCWLNFPEDYGLIRAANDNSRETMVA